MASDAAYRPILVGRAHALLNEICEFWRANSSALENGIGLLPGMKVFVSRAVDWLPSAADITKLALYADTIVVRDTALAQQARIIGASNAAPGPGAAASTLLWYLSLLELEPLFTADIHPPMAVLLPPGGTYDQVLEQVAPLISSDADRYLCELFGVEPSEEALRTLFPRFETVQDLLAALARPALLPCDVHPPPQEPIDRLWRMATKHTAAPESRAAFLTEWRWAGAAKDVLAIGLLKSLRDIYFSLACSCAIDATPLIPQRCWIPFGWKLTKDAEALRELCEPLDEVPSALTTTCVWDDVGWLGSVPPEVLVKLRQRGELEDMRQVFRAAERTLAAAPARDFASVAKDVWYRLDTALKRHRAQLSDIEADYATAFRLKVGGLVAAGALAWATTAIPLLAAPAAAVGVPTLYSTIQSYLQKRQRVAELRQRPIGILWEIKRTTAAQ